MDGCDKKVPIRATGVQFLSFFSFSGKTTLNLGVAIYSSMGNVLQESRMERTGDLEGKLELRRHLRYVGTTEFSDYAYQLSMVSEVLPFSSIISMSQKAGQEKYFEENHCSWQVTERKARGTPTSSLGMCTLVQEKPFVWRVVFSPFSFPFFFLLP